MRKRGTLAAPLPVGCRRPPSAYTCREPSWRVGNVVNAIDPLNQKTTYVYDKLNRRTQAIDARGGLTNFVFDAADNLTRLQDAASPSNGTTFVYDKLNRVTQQTDPLNKNTTFAYDAADRRTSSTDRLGRVRHYSYDARDRLKGETWVAGAGSPANTFTFTYDAADNLRSAANAAGTYTLTYDKLNRVTYEQQLFGLSLTFTYDASDNRTRVDDSLGGVTTSVYDGANRLTRREFGGTGQTPLRIDVGWTDRNQLETLTRYKWNAGAWQSIGSSVYRYDAAMRLDNLQHKDAAGVSFSNTTYGYDVAHRLTSEQYNGGTAVSLGYDLTNQLTSASGGRSESYGYDLVGNRNTTGYQTGTGNRLLHDGTYAYTYTDEGARDKKTLGASAETWTYGYDHNNRLLWARLAATDGGAATLTVTYTYDAFGQRVQEERWTAATGTVTTRFAFDGANLWADLNNANQLLMRRLYLDGVDQVFARLSAAGTAVWYATDRQGSIADYLDANGVAKYHFAYDSLGTATGSGADSSLADRLRYTGKEYDLDTKLQLHNWRWYDPRTGRWVNEDPIGLRAGDANLHRYVGNSPTNATDPSGLVLFANSKFSAESHLEWFRELGARTVRVEPVGKYYVFTYADREEIQNIINRSNNQSVKDLLGAMISNDDQNLLIYIASADHNGKATGLGPFYGPRSALYNFGRLNHFYKETTVSESEKNFLNQIRYQAIEDYRIKTGGVLPSEDGKTVAYIYPGQYAFLPPPKRLAPQPPPPPPAEEEAKVREVSVEQVLHERAAAKEDARLSSAERAERARAAENADMRRVTEREKAAFQEQLQLADDYRWLGIHCFTNGMLTFIGLTVPYAGIPAMAVQESLPPPSQLVHNPALRERLSQQCELSPDQLTHPPPRLMGPRGRMSPNPSTANPGRTQPHAGRDSIPPPRGAETAGSTGRNISVGTPAPAGKPAKTPGTAPSPNLGAVGPIKNLTPSAARAKAEAAGFKKTGTYPGKNGSQNEIWTHPATGEEIHISPQGDLHAPPSSIGAGPHASKKGPKGTHNRPRDDANNPLEQTGATHSDEAHIPLAPEPPAAPSSGG